MRLNTNLLWIVGFKHFGHPRDEPGSTHTPHGGEVDTTATGDGGRSALAGERRTIPGNSLFHRAS